eukprot:4315286-Amphidinium_carterae.1
MFLGFPWVVSNILQNASKANPGVECIGGRSLGAFPVINDKSVTRDCVSTEMLKVPLVVCNLMLQDS